MTIPAGQVGNELPIQVVSESWFSAELQAVVLSKHSDPRMGETTYRLIGINRSEQARSLFEVPADYKIEEGGGERFRQRKSEPSKLCKAWNGMYRPRAPYRGSLKTGHRAVISETLHSNLFQGPGSAQS
jgi:hypothetical protein